MKNILVVFMLLIAGPSFASRVGNGGDGVYCEKEGRVSVELLDFFEGRLRGWPPVLIGETVEEKIELFIQKVEKFDLYLGIVLREGFDHYLQNRRFTDNELVDIPDSEHVQLPKGCQIRQAAIFRMPHELIPGEPVYLVNQDLWDLMDKNSKAGLVLHEILYRYARITHHQDSVVARLVLTALASNLTETQGPWAFYQMVRGDKIGWYFRIKLVHEAVDSKDTSGAPLYLYSGRPGETQCPHGEKASFRILKENEAWLVNQIRNISLNFEGRSREFNTDPNGYTEISVNGITYKTGHSRGDILCLSKKKPKLEELKPHLG